MAWLILAIVLLMAGNPSVFAQKKPSNKPAPAPPAQRLNLPGEVSDEGILERLDSEADKLIKSDHPWIREFFHGPRAEGAMQARKKNKI